MRKGLWVAMAFVGLGLFQQIAQAQMFTRGSTMNTRASGLPGSASSTGVINVPINPNLSVVPVQQTSGASSSSIVNLFRNFSVPSFPPRHGVSNLPPPSAFPSTYYQNFKAVPMTPANDLPTWGGFFNRGK